MDKLPKLPLPLSIYYKLVPLFEKVLLKRSQVPLTPFFDRSEFSWVEDLEQNIPEMQQEMQRVLERLDELPTFQEISPRQKYITTDSKWKIFPFFTYGVGRPELEEQCPITIAHLKKIPGIKTAMYSILMPHKHIPPHRGPYRGILRLHIPLKLPDNYQQCRIEVGGETQSWEPNKCMIFDDGFIHRVWNDSDEVRVIIFVDFLRPLNSPWDAINEWIVKLFSKSKSIATITENAYRWYQQIWMARKDD